MPAAKLRFRATIKIRKINPYVLVHADHAARLKRDWRKPMPVCVRINGKPDKPWRVNLMPAGDGSFFLYLHGRLRKETGTGVGDRVSIAVGFDAEYKGGPVDPMPSWFGNELKRDRDARKGWDSLSPSRQKEILRYFGQLKSREARQRNVHRAVHVLAGGKARFMARSWNVTGDE
jgi:hypothetical protein